MLESDDENAELQAQLDEAYLRFLQAKESQRIEGTRLAKRTKKAKVTSWWGYGFSVLKQAHSLPLVS